MKVILDNGKNKLSKVLSSYILSNPETIFKYKKQGMEHIINKLDVLNPMNTLKRGYAIVKSNDSVVSDIKKIKKEDIIDINIKNGIINAKVIEVSNGK